MDINSGLYGLSLSVIVGALITAFRLWAKDQRQKGELAVRMLIDWSNHSDRTMEQCVSLADKDNLEVHEVNAIWKKKACHFSSIGRDGLLNVLQDIFEQIEWNEQTEIISLSDTQVKYIEFHWSTYLNRLEFMLAAWTNNLVNKSIMDAQLSMYLKLKNDILKRLITNEVDDCFPTIYSFRDGKRPKGILGWLQTGPVSR